MTDDSPRTPHRHAIAASVLLTAVGIMLAAQSAWPIMLGRALTGGLLASAWAAAMAGIGSVALPTRLLGAETPCCLRWATWFAAGTGLVSMLVLGLGLLGWLNGGSAWGILGTGWFVLALRMLAWGRKRSAEESTRAGWLLRPVAVTKWGWCLVCAAPGVAVLVVAPSVLPGVLWGDEPHGYDVVSYHLQIPREWFESGRIAPLAHNVFSYFPQGMEMHYLLGMHLRGDPWGGMYLAQYQHAATALLTAVAVAGSLRRVASKASDSAVSAPVVLGFVLILSTPWVPMVGTVAYNEGLLMLFAALATAWLVRAVECRSARQVLLAGAFGGLACGVKLTGVAMVVGCGAAAVLLVVRPWRRGLALSASFVLVAMICSAPWWFRTLAWAGNPVFPEATRVFGSHTFTSAQVERWEAAHRLVGEQRGGTARFRAAAVGLPLDWRFGFALLPVALLSAVAGWRHRDVRLLSAMALLQLLIWIGLTHVQGRFILTALPAMVMLVSKDAGRSGWRAMTAVSACLLGSGCTCVLVARLGELHPAWYVPETAADLWNLRPDEQIRLSGSGEHPIALAGDARAFWWPVPMSRLHYRTVFDVAVAPGESLIEAWTRGAPADAAVVVDPGELRRLVRTYRGLGDLPKEIEGREEAFILERE